MNAKSIWLLLAGAWLLGACSPSSPPAGSLSLVATVGTEPGVCADTTEITPDAGTTVYYCYTITNTGDVSIPLHGLSDDVFGVILRDFEYDLAPGASVDTVAAGVELAFEITEPTVNEATWEGFVGPLRMARAEASATVTPVELQHSLSLVATVGTEPGVCADTAEITTLSDASTTVYYCYTITNTGDVSIPLHGLSDDVFGVILRDFEYDLAPGASVATVAAGVELAFEITEPTVNEATWEGFVGPLRMARAEASTTVTTVAPLQYGAIAGTFVADSNLDTVDAYAANLIVLAIRTLDGEPVDAEVPVDITVPGFGTFTYLFDPATAGDGTVVLIIQDFGGVTPATALRGLGMPVEAISLERRPGLSASAVVGGDFIFAFPGKTLVRTVDAEASLVVPVVASVDVGPGSDALTVAFAEDGGDGVSYMLEAYGRGTNGYAGTASGATSPVVVDLNGPLGPDEAYAIDVIAVRGAVIDPFVDEPMQLDAAEYLYASEED